jgi:uncharacterized protein (DUF362 family)
MSSVSIVRIQGKQFKKAISDSLRLIGYDFPTTVQNIVIKPNMCYYWDYSTGYTTDPNFVGSLIGLIREQISPRVNISIVESDASAMKCMYAFKMLGFEDLARKYNVKLVNLSKENGEKINIKIGKHLIEIIIPDVIKNADLKINVPKIKYSMRKIQISCALKNVFGCNPYPKKFIYHSILNEAIVAVNKAMKFDLCILDGNIVAGAQTRKLSLVMASTDPVAFDSVAAHIAGVNPRFVRYLLLAEKEALGTTSFIAKGISWKYFQARFPKKSVNKKLFDAAFDIILKLHLETRLGLD